MSAEAKMWLEKIQALALLQTNSQLIPQSIPQPIRILNVCGGHERSIAMAGLRGVLPKQVELIPGPGCPVCVCPEEDLYAAIQLSLNESVILVTYGDMMRVPVNVSKAEPRTLVEARALGADIRPVASPQEVLAIARENSNQQVCFFVAGFETTTAPLAAMMAEGVPDNLSILLSARLTWPAVELLLSSDVQEEKGKEKEKEKETVFDALVAPGHVAAIMGADQWAFVSQKHGIATAVAGFTNESLLAAFYSLLCQVLDGKAQLDNCYQHVVSDQGNLFAQNIIQQVLEVVDANWRGIGIIPQSGYALSGAYSQYDARQRFSIVEDSQRKRAGEMPPACDCADVLLGKIYPNQCRLYGRTCNPRQPVGPCMVSDEGACHIWWRSGIRD